jgi:iron complex outermembrane recepter protein
MRSLLHVTLRVVLGCTALTLPAVAQVQASISGVVLSAGGDPVAGAEVELPELRRRTTTDSEGKFLFADLSAGEYLLSVSSPRFGGAVQRVAVREGVETSVEISLDKLIHSGAISVTAVGVARGLSELTTPVDVLAGEDLAFRRQSTLGETLAQQPGVTSTSYGQGSSRPVIRGLGEDRIRILENGLDTGDVSSIGPDHAVSMDPLAAERVEVVRGPATVLWGANAIGGVVNVLDGRVPDRPATAPVTGVAEVESGSNADKLSGALKLDGAPAGGPGTSTSTAATRTTTRARPGGRWKTATTNTRTRTTRANTRRSMRRRTRPAPSRTRGPKLRGPLSAPPT